MGVMSRKVVPLCGNLCIFCPAIRARSRQPVKRYKKLLAEIFPRPQDAEPNDRKIGKLCEYASKNSLRIPKITGYLEQRFYKDLRNEHVGSVKVVLCVYKKFLGSCKEQMPLFASSFLGIIRTLLGQTRRHDIQILACGVLVDFINCQADSTYMFNLEGLIPKFCELAREVGDNERALQLRAAGLQVLASMVSYMGDHSHVSMDFDKIISVTLENYVDTQIQRENDKPKKLASQPSNQQSEGWRNEDHGSLFSNFISNKHKLDPPLDASRSPSYWSRVCLHNMVCLAKEATTIRRVLDPFFNNFDSEDYWSLDKGFAFSILMYFQSLLEDSGENSHFLLSILVKHLDHKNVVKQPLKQINIILVTMQLAEYAKQQVSVAIISALSDLIKHLRKCMQYSVEGSYTGHGARKLNSDLQSAIEKCILALANKIGDVGPILDLMAVVLENIPSNPLVARSTVCSVYRTAQIISSLPNLLYQKKAFPDVLFHQLLVAMAHLDHETRIGAHYILSAMLVPSLIHPWPKGKENSQKYHSFSSIIRAQEKMECNLSSYESNNEIELNVEENQTLNSAGKQSMICQSDYGSCNSQFVFTNGRKILQKLASLRLSSHQISLLLSSIWVQATSVENTPQNFEAIAHTYNIILLFTKIKNSSHVALVRCFQLTFSLRSISLDEKGVMQLPHRRSLFTLASYMLIFSARACNLLELIPIVKSSLTDRMLDPHLELVEDVRLQAVNTTSDCRIPINGSAEVDMVSFNSLLAVEMDDQKLKETVIQHFITKLEKVPEDELFGIKKQLLQEFSLDDAYSLGSSLFMETPSLCSPPGAVDFQAFDEDVTSASPDDVSICDVSGRQSDPKTSISFSGQDVVGVNQLLESVHETARQVVSLTPSTSTPAAYDEVKNQCEALVSCKQQKMSVLHDIKQQQESKAIIVCSNTQREPTTAKKPGNLESATESLDDEPILRIEHLCSDQYGQEQSFRLPPSSPYDKFLKAAGC